jgi:hypothetical protein
LTPQLPMSDRLSGCVRDSLSTVKNVREPDKFLAIFKPRTY